VRTRHLSIAVAATALLGATAASTGHAAVPDRTRMCGLTPRIDGVRYDVHEVRGAVPCRTVKRVVTTYLRTFDAPSPWTCTLGHGSSPYAASCARGHKVLVRVYAPS
jgi:hypothetical protein